MRLQVSHAGAICRLTLCRDDGYNALDRQFIGDLSAAIAEIEAGLDAKVILFESAIDGVFSTGLDFNALSEVVSHNDLRAHFVEVAEEYCNFLIALLGIRVPTIGIIDGFAVGGGVDLLACCDLVFATDNARASVNQLRRNMFPYTTSALLVPAIGHKSFFEWLLTGVNWSAQRLAAEGLANRVCSRELIEKIIGQIGARVADFDSLAFTAGMRYRRGLSRFSVETDLKAGVPFLADNLLHIHKVKNRQ
jgi:methylglutaconyl-CoA hydratase